MFSRPIDQTDFHFPGQTAVYHGKVRDVYTIGNQLLVMVATDRISAFDVILPKPIPNKGQVLNEIASLFLTKTQQLVPNWLLDVPDPNVAIGKKCTPFKVEMVIRGYLAGHAWRVYRAGQRKLCGITLPEGLKENDPFPEPIITPSTKAAVGHDVDISREEIIAARLVTDGIYNQLENYTRKLFAFGSDYARHRGLILVDTKYEFGTYGKEILLMDEVHTPDSSRYFYLDGYEERQMKSEPQKQLSKEFVREWLIAHDFMGKEGQSVPEMDEEWVQTISKRYIELFERISGRPFQPRKDEDPVNSMQERVVSSLSHLNQKD